MPPACRICSGPLALLHPGRQAPITAAELSPTCHEPGAHADLYACERCGTVQQPALPSGPALVDLYRDMEDSAYLAEEAGRRATARRLLKVVGRHASPPGRLLEVGCGHGLLLDEARGLGWEVRGLEPAAAARAHARDVLGLDVVDATLDDLRGGRAGVTDGGFDAIVLVDVIEHLDDPVGALRACRALLADGGVLLVVTPDPSSLTARAAGPRWWGYLPAHTFLLPRRTLRRLVSDAGFEPLADGGLRRTFTLRYWLGGLGERSPALARLLERRSSGGALFGRPLTLSLGDERVLLARRGVHAPAAAPVLAPAAAAGATP